MNIMNDVAEAVTFRGYACSWVLLLEHALVATGGTAAGEAVCPGFRKRSMQSLRKNK